MSNSSNELKQTSFVADFPAKTCRLPADGKVLLESGLDYGLSLQELLRQLIVREVSMTRREHLLQILEELDGDSNYYVTWGGDE